MDEFDLVVIGAGSGGIAGAIRAAEHGARVALVEAGAVGGTCVNVGCVPKKAMWLAAQLAESGRIARRVGFQSSVGALDWPEFIGRRQQYIARIHASYRRRFEALGIELIEGRADLCGEDVQVDGRLLSARHRLIATGARPTRPALAGDRCNIDSDGVFALQAPPERICIVGSGYVGVEMAGLLHALGSEVTLVARSRHLLGNFDLELGEHLAVAMQAQGIELLFDFDACREEIADGRIVLHAVDGRSVRNANCLLWATGRQPNSSGFGLEEAGVELEPSGHVRIDEWQNTTAPGIYAVGDVTAQPALTPFAIAAARRLMDRLFGGDAGAKLECRQIPTVVFAHPPVASVGLSEIAAIEREEGPVRCYRGRYRPMLGALADDPQQSFIKLVCAGKEERVVGLHMVGPGADELLQGFAVALQMGATKRDFDATLAIHPTAAEELVLLR